MSFINRAISFDEFMERLHQRIQKGKNPAALIFFECFLQKQLPEEVRKKVFPGWDGQVVAGDFDVAYPLAANILHAAATVNASDANPGIYDEASAVSLAIKEELDELFQCSGNDGFDFLQIKPYHQMMADAGLVKLTEGPDGKTYVSPK